MDKPTTEEVLEMAREVVATRYWIESDYDSARIVAQALIERLEPVEAIEGDSEMTWGTWGCSCGRALSKFPSNPVPDNFCPNCGRPIRWT